MTPTKPLTNSQAATMTSRTAPTHTITVNGTPFAYREFGLRGDVPVVFLHHLMAVLDDWDPRVIDGIAADRHVITFDNRGVGATGGKVPHTVEEMADDAAAFIHALGHNQVDLLGFSLGGGVAQSLLLRHPQLVRRAILAGTGPAGAGGLEKMPLIAGSAYLKAALTLRNPKHFLFFPRTPNGKRAATAYTGPARVEPLMGFGRRACAAGELLAHRRLHEPVLDRCPAGERERRGENAGGVGR